VLVSPDPILCGRGTLDLIVDFISRLAPVHVKAIKGTVLKAILQYRSFSPRRDFTLALVRHMGSMQKGIQEKREVGLIYYDMAFMICLPATRRRVEFDDKEVSGALGRMVRERLAKVVAAKSGKWKGQKREVDVSKRREEKYIAELHSCSV